MDENNNKNTFWVIAIIIALAAVAATVAYFVARYIIKNKNEDCDYFDCDDFDEFPCDDECDCGCIASDEAAPAAE